MRTQVTDTRLEAIAGPPVIDTGVYTIVPSAGYQRTGIAVGLYVPSQDGSPQSLLSPVEVTGAPGEWLDPGSSYPHGKLGEVWWAYRAFGTASFFRGWQGPCRAVTYDRTLSDAKTMEIVRKLSLSLSL